jgi:hypothetical protein
VNRIAKALGVWAMVIVIIGWLAFCLVCSPARCDDVADARARLRAIEKAKTVEPAVSPLEPAFVPSPDPVPDPISVRSAPVITFEEVQKSAAVAPRLPRAVLVVAPHCSPCIRIHTENADLIGGEDAPIQLVDSSLANDLERWGIAPSVVKSAPCLFILDQNGNVHGLGESGFACCLRGYQTRAAILDYLAKPEHGVSIAPSERVERLAVANVEGGDASPETFAAVLSAHLLETSGQQKSDDQYLYGGLFDFTVDVPESWKSIGAKILSAQKVQFVSAGITVDWSGPTRSFAVSKDRLTISPPVKVSVNKFFISYGASLDGVEFLPDLSRVTFLLTGAPDLTVNLK